jgi:hypothetical protein
MRLRAKWLLVSVVGGVSIAVALFFSDTLFDAVADVPGPLGAVANVVMWPVAACLYLSGTDPNIGIPEKHLHEWTPVQDFAVVIGIGLSWVFYSSVVFLIIWNSPQAPRFTQDIGCHSDNFWLVTGHQVPSVLDIWV